MVDRYSSTPIAIAMHANQHVLLLLHDRVQVVSWIYFRFDEFTRSYSLPQISKASDAKVWEETFPDVRHHLFLLVARLTTFACFFFFFFLPSSSSSVPTLENFCLSAKTQAQASYGLFPNSASGRSFHRHLLYLKSSLLQTKKMMVRFNAQSRRLSRMLRKKRQKRSRRHFALLLFRVSYFCPSVSIH